MKVTTLHDLYVEELKDLYSAENQILNALPEMVKAANSPALKAGFEEHFQQTKEHVVRAVEIQHKIKEAHSHVRAGRDSLAATPAPGAAAGPGIGNDPAPQVR